MTAFLWNWVLTASLLIVAVLLLRAVLGRRISARLRYALWAVALLRLLVPGHLFTAPAAVLPEVPTVRQVLTLPDTQNAPVRDALPAPDTENTAPVQAMPLPNGGAPVPTGPEGRVQLDPLTLLCRVWLAGTVLTALAMLWSNLRFARRLRRVRAPLDGTDCPLRVYTAAGLPSPCLFGVLPPAVYVTPETAADPTMLRHVLAHEVTHFRHGDHVWSLLCGAALAVHWWNPLVWLAVVRSRRDAELACDEGALQRLGDGERRAYGGTLLSIVTTGPRPGDLLRCATSMVDGKRGLRERVSHIANAPKRWVWAAVVAVVLTTLLCACAFTRAEPQETEAPTQETENPTQGLPNHLTETVDVPADVLAAAQDLADKWYHDIQEEFPELQLDGWQFTDPRGPFEETVANIPMEIWKVDDYALHVKPLQVAIQGVDPSNTTYSLYITTGSSRNYLCFQLDENDRRTYLVSLREDRWEPGDAMFRTNMIKEMLSQGVIQLSALTGEELTKRMWAEPANFFNNLALKDAAEQDAVLQTLSEYLARSGSSVYRLDPVDSFNDLLTDGGRAAWEALKRIISEQ